MTQLLIWIYWKIFYFWNWIFFWKIFYYWNSKNYRHSRNTDVTAAKGDATSVNTLMTWHFQTHVRVVFTAGASVFATVTAVFYCFSRRKYWKYWTNTAAVSITFSSHHSKTFFIIPCGNYLLSARYAEWKFTFHAL